MTSIWSQPLFYKSATANLCERVDSKYKVSPVYDKGGVSYLFSLKIKFFMSYDTINAYRKHLKLYEDEGLHRNCGKNVTVSKKEIVAVYFSLNEVGTLPYKTVLDVITGLTNCSVSDFVFSCTKPRKKLLIMKLMKKTYLNRLRQF